MSAVVSQLRPAPKAAEEYLGPARVTAVSPHEVVVALPDGGTAHAGLAFTLPYTPAVGDVLLVIGRGAANYAIGVIEGRGQTKLSFEGDVELESTNGTVRLAGARGVEVRAPSFEVHTDALRMFAREVAQTFDSLRQRVRSVLRVHAGEVQTLVDGGTYTQSKTAAILADEAVTVNGREIHLG
ncbi:MAG TPA: DUF3540 domain-containing protein [Polyangiaceae bacterium]|jgi:hypothetical protein